MFWVFLREKKVQNLRKQNTSVNIYHRKYETQGFITVQYGSASYLLGKKNCAKICACKINIHLQKL